MPAFSELLELLQRKESPLCKFPSSFLLSSSALSRFLSKTEESMTNKKRSSSFVEFAQKEPAEEKRRKSEEKPKTVVLDLTDAEVAELLKDLQKAKKSKKEKHTQYCSPREEREEREGTRQQSQFLPKHRRRRTGIVGRKARNGGQLRGRVINFIFKESKINNF